MLYRLNGRDTVEEDGDGKVGDGKVDRAISSLVVNFDETLGREKPGKKIVRYQENPRAEWGPMRKASSTT